MQLLNSAARPPLICIKVYGFTLSGIYRRDLPMLMQVAEGKSPSILQTLREIHRDGGSRALFTGVGPRVVRAAPACAIVVASYEMLKAMHLKQT